jgi:prolyl-tRNA synthetase
MGLAGKGARVLIDPAVAAMGAGVTGANKTDYHVRHVVPGRDFPLEGQSVTVADIRNAVPGDTWGGQSLEFSTGIEVGHVFKLGAKYSQQLGATFLDAAGQSQPCIMGCYGIGVNRILACAIEQAGGHDENGCVLPITIAPFEVEVVPINFDHEQVRAEATRIHDELSAAGVEVLLDDRDARPGVKFKDSDLLGIPMRVVVGERGLKAGQVELKLRTESQASLVAVGQIVATVAAQVRAMKEALQPRGGSAG